MEVEKPMTKFKLIEKLEKYKYEAIAIIGLLGLIFIDEYDPLSKLSVIIMLFGMFGMLAKTISPTVNVCINPDQVSDELDKKWFELVKKVIESKKGADDE
jgi:hypothetical protein